MRKCIQLPATRLNEYFIPGCRQLLQSPYVIFAGYKIPHPLEPRFIIKVQTDGTHTPIQAIQEAVKSLILTLDKMRSLLQNEFRLAKTVGIGEMMLGNSGNPGDNLDDGLAHMNGPSSQYPTLPVTPIILVSAPLLVILVEVDMVTRTVSIILPVVPVTTFDQLSCDHLFVGLLLHGLVHLFRLQNFTIENYK
ncbi:hypothetical protein H4Q26_018297 [Puccinia striiformis f. sp. tritici PST-130]|nr:hypothetical protein H4Q26_018297 [Puccinia striiformis f. sp. tritici PST-130]